MSQRVTYKDPNRNAVDILKRFSTSYGAMMTVMSFLTTQDTMLMQQLSLWWYYTNVPRIQISVRFALVKTYRKVFYLFKETTDVY